MYKDKKEGELFIVRLYVLINIYSQDPILKVMHSITYGKGALFKEQNDLLYSIENIGIVI